VNVAEKVFWVATLLIALVFIAIASLLLLKFTEPFEATVVALLIVVANHAMNNEPGSSGSEDSQSKARAAFVLLALSTNIIIDLEAMAAIVRVLIGAYL
jgi:predicted cobalt transporter CbtA